MINFVVAFGPTNESFFIAAGSSTRKGAQIPVGMRGKLDAELNTPISLPPLAHPGSDWNTGDLAGLAEHLKARVTQTYGVTFGPGGACSWSSKTYGWHYWGLAADQIAWINKMKAAHGADFRLLVGTGHATVMLYKDNAIRYHACGDKLANTLTAAINKDLHVRYISLSTTHGDRFFVQFADHSITWGNAGQHVSKDLNDIAKNYGARVKESTWYQPTMPPITSGPSSWTHAHLLKWPVERPRPGGRIEGGGVAVGSRRILAIAATTDQDVSDNNSMVIDSRRVSQARSNSSPFFQGSENEAIEVAG
ncbi:hypothetical protein GLOTRDRAFT_94996 [Gloeophyllum trabeum ATCC 11539]|uniref:Uncharacterized protein n=1 Tax=Gloeophyllum trabeum (strain ATCC 11539 / FP-39264 / Madison 617) TaxID=670483 RepID=S7RJV4_GLOTA|nr:uncharacterized protein GLOTRDRAFT_94996 [Gloeophyllum trabeum ATCC 11539]EPQ52919.1 hypothetical protein GLOTRDRAFT_94996 [Gloeophyllum trabeum ATCC 11539]